MRKIIVSDISAVYSFSSTEKQWVHKPNITSHIVAYQLGGKYEHRCNGETYMVKEDSVIFINSADYYEVTAHEVGSCISIDFFLIEPAGIPFSVIDGNTLPHIKTDFISAFHAWNRRDEYSFCDCAALLYGIIGKLLRCSGQDSAYIQKQKYPNIIEARDYITMNFNNSALSVEDAARVAGLCRRRFGELFRLIYNTTPTRYITYLRIASAKEMLRAGSCSVGEIAASVGYESTSYFCRVFANETGVSPERWKKNGLVG